MTLEPSTRKWIGQQWCRPYGCWSSTDNYGRETMYPGYVAMQTNDGWIILCNAYMDTATGEISYERISYHELPKKE